MPSVAAFVRGWFNEPPPTFELRQASARWGQAKPRAAQRTLRVADVIQETPSTRTFVLEPRRRRRAAPRLPRGPAPHRDRRGERRDAPPLLLVLELAARRRPAGDHRQAHARRARVAAPPRPGPGGRHAGRRRADRQFHRRDRPLLRARDRARRGRRRDHAADEHRRDRAARRARQPRGAALRQPQRGRDHLSRSASRGSPPSSRRVSWFGTRSTLRPKAGPGCAVRSTDRSCCRRSRDGRPMPTTSAGRNR